jgi:hypothetical protein
MPRIARRWRRALLLAALFAAVALGAGARHARAEDAPPPPAPPRSEPLSEPLLRLVTVSFADQHDANRLAGQLDVWAIDHRTRTLTALVTLAQQEQLVAAGRQVRPVTSMTGAAVPNFACYRTVEETYTDLAALAAARPDLAQWVDIGDSWTKVRSGGTEGYDLNALVLTNTAIPGPKPRLFVMAAIHARELTTAEVAARFAEQLVARYGADPEATWLLDYNEIHVLAQANPDGRKRAEGNAENTFPGDFGDSWWRKNVNDDNFCSNPNLLGVDLNRNSSFRWGGCTSGFCSSTDPCSLVYRGPGPASEPETQAIEAYIRSLFPDRRGPNDTDAAPADTQGVMISLHSYSELVLFPWGWNPLPSPNDAGLRTLGRKFGYFTGYKACQAGEDWCIYMTDGTTDDFAYGELGVASYTFELGTTFAQQCSYFDSSVLSQTVDALTYAAKVAVEPYQLPSGPDVVAVAVTPTLVGAGSTFVLHAEADDSRTAAFLQLGQEPVQPIAAMSYTVDAPPWLAAAGVPVGLQPLDSFDTPRETATAVVSTQDWALGRHTIFVQAVDAAGNAGPPTAVFVEVGQPVFLPYVGADGKDLETGLVPDKQEQE